MLRAKVWRLATWHRIGVLPTLNQSPRSNTSVIWRSEGCVSRVDSLYGTLGSQKSWAAKTALGIAENARKTETWSRKTPKDWLGKAWEWKSPISCWVDIKFSDWAPCPRRKFQTHRDLLYPWDFADTRSRSRRSCWWRISSVNMWLATVRRVRSLSASLLVRCCSR